MGLAMVGVLVSYAFDGHTVTEGNRLLTSAVDVVHVAAAAVWVGGVVITVALMWLHIRAGETADVLDLALRFSVVAAVALAVAGVAGSALAVIILDSPAELWSTTWGRILIVKIEAVVSAAALAGYNHFVVLPWLHEDPFDEERAASVRNRVTVEAAILVGVVVVTALLIGASTA